MFFGSKKMAIALRFLRQLRLRLHFLSDGGNTFHPTKCCFRLEALKRLGQSGTREGMNVSKNGKERNHEEKT